MGAKTRLVEVSVRAEIETPGGRLRCDAALRPGSDVEEFARWLARWAADGFPRRRPWPRSVTGWKLTPES